MNNKTSTEATSQQKRLGHTMRKDGQDVSYVATNRSCQYSHPLHIRRK